MKVHIVLPYPNTAALLYTWAKEEKTIDFRRERERAERCTVAFAATELVSYLGRLGCEVSYSASREESEVLIELVPGEGEGEEEEALIARTADGVRISAPGRMGILYGVYEFLTMQGIRWISPDYEVLPKKPLKGLLIPEEPKAVRFDMALGRGFDFEGLLKDSTKLWLWMSRNGLNLAAYRPYTAAFQKKLGMSFKMGGHIFERILDPDRRLESGRTLWEEHNDWYGYEPERKREKETALHTQFCMSNPELLKFLGEELLRNINEEWYEADRIDVWTFDTWGRTCQCEGCKKLGNSTDQTLHFLSYMREALDQARKENRLDHDVRLVMCSYEGTQTLEPPANAVPENLKKSGDYITYYPILRCYQHTFADPKCNGNAHYRECLEGWKDIPIMFGEYYNVSKSEDLPLLFTKTMQKDFQYYHKVGVTGMTYMHLPMLEWGVRNVTQLLYAKLCRDVNTDVEAFLAQYFEDRYQSQARQAAKAYELCEMASEYSASWRSWSKRCMLSRLREWDGEKPTEELSQEEHFKGEAVRIGQDAIRYLNEAVEIMRDAKRERQQEFVRKMRTDRAQAVNPQEILLEKKDAIIAHMDEDIRLLVYGRDVMELTVLFIRYYNALRNEEESGGLWADIDRLAEKLAGMYMPLKYINSMDNIELRCDDCLERSQLRSLYYRCLRYRVNQKEQ